MLTRTVRLYWWWMKADQIRIFKVRYRGQIMRLRAREVSVISYRKSTFCKPLLCMYIKEIVCLSIAPAINFMKDQITARLLAAHLMSCDVLVDIAL